MTALTVARGPTWTPPARTSRAIRIAELLALLAVLAAVAGAVAWRAAGGAIYVVRTASMGTAAPVGSLLFDRPAMGPLRVGELITFRVPGADRLITHRVHGLRADGTIVTQGDANGTPDGWQLHRADVRGRVVATVRYVGWLVRAVPFLAAGFALVWAVLRRLGRSRPRDRATLAAAGATVVVAVVTAALGPLWGAEVISFTRGEGGAGGSVVSTGVLPVRVSAEGGTATTISIGEVAHVITTRLGPGHRYRLHVAPDLQLWWIVPLAALTLLPGLLAAAPARDSIEPCLPGSLSPSS